MSDSEAAGSDLPAGGARGDDCPFRVGHGHDIHRLQPGGRLVLAGTIVAEDRSSIAHSDGDVVAHAVVDAILGALGEGDIGRHFPDSDSRWKNAPGSVFLRAARQLAAKLGWDVVNVDVTIIAESPRLGPYVPEMVRWLAGEVGGQANVKAGTNERCDAIGRGEAISATAIVLLASTNRGGVK